MADIKSKAFWAGWDAAGQWLLYSGCTMPKPTNPFTEQDGKDWDAGWVKRMETEKKD